MIIYKATNLINGKVYIGQTTRPLKDRIREHNHTSKGGRFRTYFYNAILKHGKHNFKWEIIDRASSVLDLNEKEIFWVERLKSTDKNIGYNNKLGGGNGRHLPAARDKISEAGRRPCSQETKDKISRANKGQIPWTKGREFTKDHRLKIAMSQKKRIINPRIAGKIKDMLSSGLYKSTEIAAHFNIKAHIVYNIKNGTSWRHV